MTMEVASETSDFYIVLGRMIELEDLTQQAICFLIQSGRNATESVASVVIVLRNYKLCY
jgi:hypothetical protein